MSYKPKFFRDRYGSQDVQGLDVFGSGHHEYSLGYDAFNNLSKVFWGVSQSLRLSSRTDLGQGLSAQPGLMSSYIASVGTAFHKSNKIMAGYILGVRSPRKSNGQDVADTKMTSHGLYVGADYKIKADTQVRATFTAAGLGNSKNTARTGGLTLGLFHTWL